MDYCSKWSASFRFWWSESVRCVIFCRECRKIAHSSMTAYPTSNCFRGPFLLGSNFVFFIWSFDFEHYLLSTLSSFLTGDFNFKITVLSRKYTYIVIYVFDDHLLLLTNKSEAIFPQSFSIMLLESSSGLYSIILYITLRPF